MILVWDVIQAVDTWRTLVRRKMEIRLLGYLFSLDVNSIHFSGYDTNEGDVLFHV